MGRRTTNTGGIPAAASLTESTEWELGVAYILHSWAALSVAVNSQWGGPNSSEKRDWLCGAVADMFDETAAANTGVELDEYDVEETLAQVMVDEFGVDVQDESILPVSFSFSCFFSLYFFSFFIMGWRGDEGLVFYPRCS